MSRARPVNGLPAPRAVAEASDEPTGPWELTGTRAGAPAMSG